MMGLVLAAYFVGMITGMTVFALCAMGSKMSRIDEQAELERIKPQ
jgi:hypothetical protein